MIYLSVPADTGKNIDPEGILFAEGQLTPRATYSERRSSPHVL